MSSDDEATRAIVVALRRIVRAIDRHSSSLVTSFGLTGPQIVILSEIAENGPVAVGILARRVHLAQGTLSEILDRLEQKGFVERRRSSDDNRRVECLVTQKTRELLERKPPLLQQQFVTELAKLAGWERSLLLASLERIASMMHAEVDAGVLLTSGPAAASAEKTAEFLKESGS